MGSWVGAEGIQGEIRGGSGWGWVVTGWAEMGSWMNLEGVRVRWKRSLGRHREGPGWVGGCWVGRDGGTQG